MKLNEIAKTNKITAFGFQAFKDFAALSPQNGNEVIISTLSPAIMHNMDIDVYYAPVLPRGLICNTAEDVEKADLDLQQVMVMQYLSWDNVNHEKIVIVSRHQGTIEKLKEMYPDVNVLSGNISPDDIENNHVIGTLPPHLIQHCQSYKAVTIKDFDYSKDGDLSGDDLADRMIISQPIIVTIN